MKKENIKELLELLCCLISIISFVYNFAFENGIQDWKKNEEQDKTLLNISGTIVWVIVQRRENSTFEQQQ